MIDGGDRHENDVPAQEGFALEGSWFSCQNGDSRRQKSAGCEKSQRQKSIDGSIKPLAGGFIVSRLSERDHSEQT